MQMLSGLLSDALAESASPECVAKLRSWPSCKIRLMCALARHNSSLRRLQLFCVSLQSDDDVKVLQAETFPSFSPAVNQRCRCAEEP